MATAATTIDRATGNDLVSLATDVGPVPMHVGAVLWLEGGALDRAAAVTELAERVEAVPRLRQRLRRTPPGCGRPVWVDDAGFDPAAHIGWVDCPPPGDDGSLLSLATDLIFSPLPRDRPLWRAAFVDGLDTDRTALVVAFHHVLADGIGGLAMLAALVDGAPPARVDGFPEPGPSVGALLLDATRQRARTVVGLPDGLRRLGRARTLLARSTGRAPDTCFNRPTGARRRLALVRTPLDDVRDAAHRHGVTVNDVILAASGAAIGRALEAEGDRVDVLRVSVPVSDRRHATAEELGNHVDIAPVDVPTRGDAGQRLHEVGGATSAAKRSAQVVPAAWYGTVFRVLAALRLFRPVMERERLVNTFVTNLRGPGERLAVLGRPVVDIAAVSPIAGNVGVAVAALSYAGTLGLTVIVDPDLCRDPDGLAASLADELDVLVAT